MFKKKILLSAATIALSMGALVACGGSSKKSGTLYVCVYDGGYGTEWIDTLAKNYEAETGVHVEWEANASILDTIENQLTGVPDFDIYMSHNINWKEYARAGLLENLDDLYASDVKVGNGIKKFSQRVVPDALEVSKQDDHYYKVCYTQGAGGLVYNVDMFEKNNWKVPTTYDELATLCQTIVDANLSVGRDKVAPIAWAGGMEFYWDYVVFEWWAQLAGLDGEMGINKIKQYLGPTGKYSDGYEMYNPDTYGKTFKQAYEKWYNLIALNTNYCVANSHTNNLSNAQAYFNAGKAAMIPYAQWAKNELQQANDGNKLDFDVAMMKTPKLSADSVDYNYNVGFGDTMLIPNKIADESKGLAKDFLRYLATPEACRTFVEKSQGAFLAFDYNDVELGDLVNDTFIKSVYDKITQCKNFNVYSPNPMAYANADSLMPWVNNYYVYAAAAGNPASATPDIVGAKLYDIAKQNWKSWMNNAHVSD